MTEVGETVDGLIGEKTDEAAKDKYCWFCHKDAVTVTCSKCIKSFHINCLTEEQFVHSVSHLSLLCNECRQLGEEGAGAGGPSVGCVLEGCPDKDLFPKIIQNKINDVFKELNVIKTDDRIVYPIDLAIIMAKTYDAKGSSVRHLFHDLDWLHHNTCIINGSTHKKTKKALVLREVIEEELEDYSRCVDCFNHYYSPKYDAKSYFSAPCRRPHALVWAKFSPYPFWPAKVLKVDTAKAEVKVKFFGSHDRAWVSIDSCYLLTRDYLWRCENEYRVSLKEALDDLNTHLKLLESTFGRKLVAASGKVNLDPQNVYIGQYDANSTNLTERRREGENEESSISGSPDDDLEQTLTLEVNSGSELDDETDRELETKRESGLKEEAGSCPAALSGHFRQNKAPREGNSEADDEHSDNDTEPRKGGQQPRRDIDEHMSIASTDPAPNSVLREILRKDRSNEMNTKQPEQKTWFMGLTSPAHEIDEGDALFNESWLMDYTSVQGGDGEAKDKGRVPFPYAWSPDGHVEEMVAKEKKLPTLCEKVTETENNKASDSKSSSQIISGDLFGSESECVRRENIGGRKDNEKIDFEEMDESSKQRVVQPLDLDADRRIRREDKTRRELMANLNALREKIERGKSQQWCAHCEDIKALREFACCWNNSYCSNFCKHNAWGDHEAQCTKK